MRNTKDSLFGLSREDKQRIMDKMLQRKSTEKASTHSSRPATSIKSKIPEEYYSIDKLPRFKELQIQAVAAEKFSIENPFFLCHDSIATNTTTISGRNYINYSSYNYLGLNGHPKVSKAAKDAIDRYGTTASASRVVSGERPIHRDLERGLAEFHGTEGCVVFVSGHAANVTTIGCLFGKNDLIIHDSLAHNSIIQGALLSGSRRLSFSHNDYQALDRTLEENRRNYERVIIIVEGIYSMDGDTPDLNRIIEIKKKHKVFLMVDEAHSIGVLGKTGHGVQEHFSLKHGDIDIIMGTLSKSLVACGGYIAGNRSLIEFLKYSAPGFVYSVGMSPPVAAAAQAALTILQEEPERVSRLQNVGIFFRDSAQKEGLDTGHCQGYAIAPVIVGSSILSAKLSNNLFKQGINVQPIIYPAVEERAARLRFFLSANHTREQVSQTITLIVKELSALKKNPIYKFT